MPDWLPPLLLAPFVGSFLGVLVLRLPEGRPVALARSACPSCDTVLAPLELVPLLSYAMLRGRCRHCRAPIGRFHPAIELAALLVAALAVAIATGRAAGLVWLWAGCVLGWTVLSLACIDLRCLRLPDVLTLPLLLLGLLATGWLDPDSLADHAAAAAAGYFAFRLLDLAYRRLRGRSGLGAGDAKLLAAAGAWLGSAWLPLLVLLAAMATLLVALLQGRGRLNPLLAVPFGPGLAASLWLIWLCCSPPGP